MSPEILLSKKAKQIIAAAVVTGSAVVCCGTPVALEISSLQPALFVDKNTTDNGYTLLGGVNQVGVGGMDVRVETDFQTVTGHVAAHDKQQHNVLYIGR